MSGQRVKKGVFRSGGGKVGNLLYADNWGKKPVSKNRKSQLYRGSQGGQSTLLQGTYKKIRLRRRGNGRRKWKMMEESLPKGKERQPGWKHSWGERPKHQWGTLKVVLDYSKERSTGPKGYLAGVRGGKIRSEWAVN